MSNVRELLRGCEVGRIQSVGSMQVIPLTALVGETDERFVAPNRLQVASPSYGTLQFRNMEPEKVAIIPQGITYAKTGAQAHTLPHVGLVKERARFETAACIQQTQGGHIAAGEAGEIRLMPMILRLAGFKWRRDLGYNKLWQAISQFNQRLRLPGTGHAEHFEKQYAHELDQFVAEFEPVERQVGAIFLINGRVVGIERTPNYGYWRKMWRAVVRDCYGGLALYLAKTGETPRPSPTRLALDASGLTTLLGLRERLATVTRREEEAVRAAARALMDETVTAKLVSSEQGLQVEDLESRHFVGHLVTEGARTVYATLMATEDRLKLQQAAQPFTI